MALVPDQKFSTFQAGDTPTTGDIIVGLRGGINTKFNYIVPGAIDSITGTANQVLANGSTGVPVTGAVTLSTPQDIATSSSPTFVGLTLSDAIVGATALKSSGGLNIATMNTVPGAVNYLTFTNSSTGLGPILGVAGSDGFGIQLNLKAMGEGAVAVMSAAVNNAFIVQSGTNYLHQTVFSFEDTVGDVNIRYQDASGTVAFLSDIPGGSPSPLTRVNDTNVTVTLGGTPSTALLQAVSLTMGWTGELSAARGGTGVNNGSNTLTLAGTLATSGAFASIFTMTGATNVTFPTSGTLATTSQLPTPAALTKVDDTNVTLTLGGTPATALLQATSLTLGWTGTLSGTRGGTGVNNGSSTFTMGGNVAFSGAFTFTGTLTGNTAVTFPTSGTLATTAGTVSSVTGTANRITSTGGTTPVIDISA